MREYLVRTGWLTGQGAIMGLVHNIKPAVNRVEQGTFGLPPYILLAGGMITLETTGSGD